MFKKPFKVKSNSQLKGSDRKKLRSDISQQFPQLTEDALNLILPHKETMFQLKILSHSDQLVIVYCIQKLPIVFEIEKVMYPTVYMLWHVPDLLPTFTTHPQVLPVIARGADLMLPGVVVPDGEGLHAYGRLQKGDRVAVNLTNNKAPVAVGTAAHSSYDMYMCAKRGKCVEVLHYYGDLLSTYGTKLVIPELGPPLDSKSEKVENIELMLEDQNEDPNVKNLTNLAEKVEINSEKTENFGSSVIESRVPEVSPSENYEEVKDNSEENFEPDAQSNSTEPSKDSPSMDEILKHCFFKCLRTTMKKVELPLLTSNFYKLHMIPMCPKSLTLDIKKTSYKKLSVFLDEMAKSGVIQIESLQKGVQSISKIDYNNETLKQFVDNFSNEEEEGVLVVDTSQTNKSSAPEIIEKYTVTAAVLPLFYNYDYKKKEAVTGAVVRKVIGDYVRVKNLQNPENKREVLLDDVLRSATNSPSTTEVLSWELLVSSVFGQMGHSFKVELSGCEMPAVKGKLQPIDIQVGTRSGNKKVTLVNNLELFGINLTEFSRECQHGVAASTTINTLPSAKSAQVQIQGNQVTFVGKLLMEKYQIPKRYIRGLENAPKRKK